MTDNTGTKKRRRIAQACDECRDRKRRCDGQRPICGPCSRRQTTECVWDEGKASKGWSSSYVQSLRDRIHELEKSQGRRLSESYADGIEKEGQAINALLITAPQQSSDLTPGQHDSWQLIDVPETQIPASQSRPLHLGIRPRDANVTHSSKSIALSEEALAVAESEDDSEVDAMGVFGSAAGRTRRTSDYCGPSSTLSLLSEARRIMSRHSDETSSRSASNDLHGTSAYMQRTQGPAYAHTTKRTRRAGFDLSLPTRSQADALLDSYWTWFHSLYPFLYRPAFDSRYQELWLSSDDTQMGQVSESYYSSMDDNLFHCMLNVVFALGSNFDPSIEHSERSKISSTFFDRAKALVKFDILTQNNIFLVQALLLMAQYLQSTEMATACWNVAGLAIRVAQGIGLHHDQHNCEQPCCANTRPDVIETEMRRRAWTGCILLDRVLSMAYGRHLCIHPTISQRCIVPRAIDDGLLSGDVAGNLSASDKPLSLTECYVQSTKLQMILGEVLSTFYDGSEDRSLGYHVPSSPPTMTSIVHGLDEHELESLMNLDSKVVKWRSNLPGHVDIRQYEEGSRNRPSTDQHRTSIFHRQAVVIHSRFLHVRLMMFRPVLSFLIHESRTTVNAEKDNSMKAAVRQSMLAKGLDLCASSARELLSLVTRYWEQASDLLPPPWYSVYYVHCISIVFLLGRICPIGPFEDQDLLLENWQSCLAFFKAYSSRTPSAKRCYNVLRALEVELFDAQRQHPTHDLSTARAAEMGNRRDAADTGDPMQTGSGEQAGFDFGMAEDPWLMDFRTDVSNMNWMSSFPFLDPLEDDYI